MSETIAKLRKTTEDELIEKHDEKAKDTVVGIEYYLNELSRRDNKKINKSMLRLTKCIAFMTAVMLIFTITNIIFVVLGK